MQQSTSRNIFWLIVFSFFALLARIAYLGRDQIWMDEAYSAIVSSWPISKILAEIPGIGSPPPLQLSPPFLDETLGKRCLGSSIPFRYRGNVVSDTYLFCWKKLV